MPSNHERSRRELATIGGMVAIFCTGMHGVVEKPCGDCQRLFERVKQAFAVCPYKEDKPVCGKCPTNCFEPAVREQLRRVMGYAGPRMLVRHPVLALRHCLDALRSTKH